MQKTFGTTQIRVKHNFETAHRLPFLGGKCANLHGHSWRVEITLFASMQDEGIDANGLSVDFSLIKKHVRGWIDSYLDHGCMLGVDDPLVPVLYEEGSKIYTFGEKGDYEEYPWPTVEAVARMLAWELGEVLDIELGRNYVFIDTVVVREKWDNASIFLNGTRHEVTNATE
jgi:6-pyruvoyltetrahydropterin/6-carboxytetrahydropterin synthase